VKEDGSTIDGWEIGVHIADVAYFVTEDTPLDEWASARATSVYLVDRVGDEKLAEDIRLIYHYRSFPCYHDLYVNSCARSIPARINSVFPSYGSWMKKGRCWMSGSDAP